MVLPPAPIAPETYLSAIEIIHFASDLRIEFREFVIEPVAFAERETSA